jgi:hypothetical protein
VNVEDAMRYRLLRVGVLAAGLFTLNATARLAARFGYGDGTAEHQMAQDNLAWVGWGALALILAVTAAWWARLRPIGEVAGEMAVAAGVAGLLYVTVGPFLSEPPRFLDGVGGAIVDLAVYLLVAGVGAAIGALIMIAAGLDHKSRLLKSYAQARSTKPRRAVRG